jgi:7,8-dihydropterin-6-yl-methyl-4-(beta-D-ribofuranosyl)aminobenzene 5'-phosphate synthase
MKQTLIRIIYDNRKDNLKMQEGWGFSCIIEVDHRKILFDTGADKEAFFANLQHLKISPEEITDAVFSHKHGDHVAGMEEILGRIKGKVRLFVPKGFPVPRLPPLVQMTCVSDFHQIDTHVYSLVLKGGFRLYEQALILRTGQGLAIITGCAHPGIIRIIEIVKERLNEPIHLVLGGFHLFRKNRTSIDTIVDRFKTLQVERVAPCHCSGDVAIAQFENAYSDSFYRTGTGTVLTLEG